MFRSGTMQRRTSERKAKVVASYMLKRVTSGLDWDASYASTASRASTGKQQVGFMTNSYGFKNHVCGNC